MSRAFYSIDTTSGEVKNDGNAPGFRGEPVAEKPAQSGGMNSVTYREGGQATAVVYEGGQLRSKDVTRTEAVARTPESLAAATSPESMVRMKDGDLVPAKLLVQMGYAVQSGSGYSVTEAGKAHLPFDQAVAAPALSADAAAATNTVNTVEEPASTEPFDEKMARSVEAQDAITGLVAVVGDQSSQAYVNALLDGSLEAAETILTATELKPEHRERVASLRQEFSAKLDAVALDAGIEADDLPAAVEWAEQNHKAALRAARAEALDGRTSKLRSLAKAYQDSRVLAADCGDGVTVFPGRDGKVMLHLKGYGTVSYEEAVSKNLVKVSRG